MDNSYFKNPLNSLKEIVELCTECKKDFYLFKLFFQIASQVALC